MDLHDTPCDVNRTQMMTPVPSHPPFTSHPVLRGEQADIYDNSPAGWRQDLAQDVLWPEYLEQRSAEASSTPSASPHQKAAASLTAGTMLSHMMTLGPSRAPLATQDELRATLQHFSKRGMALPRDRFYYTQAGFIELIALAMEKRLLDSSQTGDLFVGIQRLSRAASQFPRYWALGQQVRQVCLYGLNDLQQAPERLGIFHAHLVTLVLDQSRKTDLEWFRFVVIETPELSTALVSQQIEGDLWSDSLQTRTYKGFWTFDSTRVHQIARILHQAARILME